jgi:hypothetical protein
LYFPAGQPKQAEEPGASLYLPCGHGEHLSCIGSNPAMHWQESFESLPGNESLKSGHDRQNDEFILLKLGLNLPASQLTHSESPGVDLKLPAEQGTQFW